MEKFVFKSKARVALSHRCNLKCVYCDNSRCNSADKIVSMEDYRSTPISQGVISSADYIEILSALYSNGFDKLNFTGGEPMLNSDWDLLVREAKRIGFKSVEMTTNGTLIGKYLSQYYQFPEELDRLIVSIDTYDPIAYTEIVGANKSLDEIIQNIQLLKYRNPKLLLTANCVLLQHARINYDDYISFIANLRFDSITFLDLVVRDLSKKEEVKYFEGEFLSGDIIKELISEKYGELPIHDGRHSYNVILPNGLSIGLSDTKGLTRRDDLCDKCPCFCQEGLYTVRVATDGTISDCLSPFGIKINARESIIRGTLKNDIKAIYKRIENGRLDYCFNKFRSLCQVAK